MPLKAVEYPADLTQPCPELQAPADTTGKALLPWAIETVHAYNDCKARHGALVKSLRVE